MTWQNSDALGTEHLNVEEEENKLHTGLLVNSSLQPNFKMSGNAEYQKSVRKSQIFS